MTDNINWVERRQFGRRPLNADAVAELPGRIEVPCVIENLSEGGALLSFPTGVAPIEHFDLVVEDVGFRTPCEMRYQVGIRFGVRFKRVEHGEALIRHFFKATPAPATPNEARYKGSDRQEISRSSIRQLRETLLPLFSPENAGSREASVAAPAHQPDGALAIPAGDGGDVPTTTGRPNLPSPPPSSRPARIITRR